MNTEQWAAAVAFYGLSRNDPKVHLSDDLAATLIEAASFGLNVRSLHDERHPELDWDRLTDEAKQGWAIGAARYVVGGDA